MPIFIPLICLVAMGLALFRRSVPLSRPARRFARTWFRLTRATTIPRFLDLPCRRAQYGGAQGDTGAPWLLQPPSHRARRALSPLLNDLGAISDDVVLVLDDYHVIDARDVQDGMDFLLDHLPPQIHLLIASRADPPLPLIVARPWRAGRDPRRRSAFHARRGHNVPQRGDGTGTDRSRHTHVGGG